MKLTDNFDYLNVKSHMQSKYDDIDFLPNDLRNSIKAILKICEEQEKEIELLKKPRCVINAQTGEVTKIESNEETIKLQKENKKLKQLLKYCFEEGLIGE